MFTLLLDMIEQAQTQLYLLFGLASSRLYWPWLLTPLVLIIGISSYRVGLQYSLQQALNYLHPRMWFHKTSAQDTGFIVFNSLLKAKIIIPVMGSQLALAMAVAVYLQQHWGDSALVGSLSTSRFHSVWVIGLFSLLFFIIEDASRFSLHYLMHKLPFLWLIHKSHHSAQQLTPLTVHRVHPLEVALAYGRRILVFALLAGGFTWLFREQATVWQLLGVDALGLCFNAFGANLRHSPIYLSFGRFEHWFISPAQHQIHHSTAPIHHDKNFGTCLAIWDKLAGSWLAAQPASTAQPLTFGLQTPTNTPKTAVIAAHQHV